MSADQERDLARKRHVELLERANGIWKNQQMSTNTVATKLLDLIIEHCAAEETELR